GEPVLQIACETVGVIAHRDSAYPAVTARNEDGAQRALPNGETNLGVDAAGAVACRGHAEHVVGFGIESSAGVVSRPVDCVRYRSAANELLPHTFGAVRDGVCLRG